MDGRTGLRLLVARARRGRRAARRGAGRGRVQGARGGRSGGCGRRAPVPASPSLSESQLLAFLSAARHAGDPLELVPDLARDFFLSRGAVQGLRTCLRPPAAAIGEVVVAFSEPNRSRSGSRSGSMGPLLPGTCSSSVCLLYLLLPCCLVYTSIQPVPP